jgi:hypothetical protein
MEVCGDSATQYGDSEEGIISFSSRSEGGHTNTQVTIYVHIGNILLLDGFGTDVQ